MVSLKNRKRKFDVHGKSVFFKFCKFDEELEYLRAMATVKRRQNFYTRIIPYSHPTGEKGYALWIRPK